MASHWLLLHDKINQANITIAQKRTVKQSNLQLTANAFISLVFRRWSTLPYIVIMSNEQRLSNMVADQPNYYSGDYFYICMLQAANIMDHKRDIHLQSST